jgi:histidinol-phosphate aminotransferase
MSYFRDNIEEMAGYVPGYQPKDADVVKLNTNENPYPPSPKVCQGIKDIDPDDLRRYPDPSGTAFREAAAKIYNLKSENIICCNGGDDLLKTTLLAFCDKTKPAAWPVPTYSLYPVLARMIDCEIIEIPFDNEFNLPAQLTSTGAALTIVCNPNAPSGSFISVDEIASLADELKGVLMIDEAYVDFADDNCARLVENFDNLLILRTMSKGYSLAGIRFGYGIAQASLIEGLNKVRDSYSVDAVAIAAATAAVSDQKYFKANVEKIKAERTRLTGELRNLGFDAPASSSNFILAKCRDSSAEDIYDKLVKRKIYVRFFNVPSLDDKLRITVGTKKQNDILINALKEIL